MNLRRWVPRKRKLCPKCGQKLVPVVYGLPSPELVRDAEQGKVILGGCVIIEIGRKLACPRCHSETDD